MKNAARIATGLAVALAATVAAAQKMPEGYTCCNLHYDKDWISDANWRAAPFIPAGAKIKVLAYGDNRVDVEIDGKPMRIGQDYGRREESLQKFAEKLVVRNNPRGRIDRYPEKIRAAIKESRVIPGMTREQVIVSVGYPPTHKTHSVDSPVWNLWNSRAGRYEVHWNSKGTVENIVGKQ